MEIARPLISLSVVFVLLAAAVWALRRGRLSWGPTRRGGAGLWGRRCWNTLEPVERVPLTPHHALHVVRIAGKILVVATHPGGCSLLVEAGRGANPGANE